MKKKKIFLMLFITLSLFLSSSMITFADENDNSAQVTVDVKAGVVFVNEYDHTSITMQVEVGKTMQELPHAEIDGYTFDGWYLDGVCWNFKVDTVKENMTLKARYIKNTGRSDNIIAGIVNNVEGIEGIELSTISKKDALIIVDKYEDLKKAINDDKDVIIFVEVEELKDESVLKQLGISSDNAIVFDIKLYAQIVGEPSSKKLISNTNGYKTKLSIALNKEQASKIGISSKKEYYALIDNNGTIETASVSVKELNGNYIFTFEIDKFPSYGIYSKDKKTDSHFTIPKTGVVGLLTGSNSSSSILRLILIGLLACTFAVGKKNNNK